MAPPSDGVIDVSRRVDPSLDAPAAAYPPTGLIVKRDECDRKSVGEWPVAR
jgi:hypothetical protein